MTLLLTLFFLFSQANDLSAAKFSAVDFSAVKHGPPNYQSCIEFKYREVTFRVKNRSNNTIYIQGRKTDGGYFPDGYMIRLDGQTNQWLNPKGNTSHPPYKQYGVQGTDIYVLQPGSSMKFQEFPEDALVGSRLKWGIYISISKDEEPRMVTSKEFILR